MTDRWEGLLMFICWFWIHEKKSQNPWSISLAVCVFYLRKYCYEAIEFACEFYLLAT